jgi:hypothetical protein
MDAAGIRAFATARKIADFQGSLTNHSCHGAKGGRDLELKGGKTRAPS